MNVGFETTLLKMVDKFLISNPSFEAFLRFTREFDAYRTRLSREAIGDLLPAFNRLTPDELSAGKGIATEAYRRLDEQLPPDRNQFFLLISERAAWTGENLSPREREWGWGTLEDFLALVRRERQVYRERWGV